MAFESEAIKAIFGHFITRQQLVADILAGPRREGQSVIGYASLWLQFIHSGGRPADRSSLRGVQEGKRPAR